MKKIISIIFLLFIITPVFAEHTKGGWVYYEYLGNGSAANTARYHIVFNVYTECVLTSGQNDDNANITFNDIANPNNTFTISANRVSNANYNNCTLKSCHPCLDNIPSICYKILKYEVTRDLPITSLGYTVSYARCCRIPSIINLVNSDNFGDIWSVTIPGVNQLPLAYQNNSAKFLNNDTVIVCHDSYFEMDFSATDVDNDSLTYDFGVAYSGGSKSNSTPANANLPFGPVVYSNGYSYISPLGSKATIDHSTGLISGIAPSEYGTYVVTVVCSEYDRVTGIKKAEVRKSVHLQVSNCQALKPQLAPDYTFCNDYTVNFGLTATNPLIETLDWYFGDGTHSSLDAPSHTYAVAGDYPFKVVANQGKMCTDSSMDTVHLYPGFKPAFDINGKCKNTDIQFVDKTTASFGVVNKWSWTFGDISSANNSSVLQNPTHNYLTSGTYQIHFDVSSSKGCKGFIDTTYIISDKPSLSIPSDTLICIIDTIQINALGVGTFLWSPNYNISNINISNPLISPKVNTKYYVKLTDAFGCYGVDSIDVNVTPNVVQSLFPTDTTICQTDSIKLRLVSNALHFIWTPFNGSINDSSLKNPKVTPLNTTNYHVIGNIGKCKAENDINVKVVPYPIPNASNDTMICNGTNVQLFSSGGSIYSWSPNIYLSNSKIANPWVKNPLMNVRYIVSVKDVLGCPKPKYDTVFVTVAKVNAFVKPSDTTLSLNQPLQLNASGTFNYIQPDTLYYTWSPSKWLSNTSIKNPITNPLSDIYYTVKITNKKGCWDTAGVHIKYFKIKADIYVPNAFTPDGIGANNYFYPILIGIKSLDVFNVYNRWGELVYTGEGNNAKGWDGTYKGRSQDPATFVWYAEATDFLGNKIVKKGYVILVR